MENSINGIPDIVVPKTYTYNVYKSMMIECLWVTVIQEDIHSKLFLETIMSHYKPRLYTTEYGLIDTQDKTKFVGIPVFDVNNIVNEWFVKSILMVHAAQYPDISVVDIARTTLYDNPAIFEIFSLKERVIIVHYLAKQSKDELTKTFMNMDVQCLIDRLWREIVMI